MKHLLLTTALIAAGAAGTSAVAQSESNSNSSPFMAQSAEGQIQASDFIGMRVYAAADTGDLTEADGADENWEDIGEINDVIMNRDGQVQAVLVDIGGFLGIGERQVAASLDQIQFVSDNSTEASEDFFLVLNADPSTLEDAPSYGADEQSADAGTDAESDDQNADMAANDEAADGDADEGVAQAAENAENAAEEAGEDVAQAAENTGEAVEEGAEEMAAETGEAADEAQQEVAEAGEAVEEGAEEMAAETGEAADEAGEEMAEAGEAVEDGAEEMAAEADQATDEAQQEMAEAGNAAEEETNEMAADSEGMTDEESQTAMAPSDEAETMDGNDNQMAEGNTESGFPGTPVQDSYLTAENLDGARVYDASDKWVGEISELIITEEGQITDAIIDVGGFLGIGEKPVALKLSDLQILRQDGGDEVRIYTAMAEEELKSMPEFEPQQ